MALGLLVVIKLVAERDLLPEGDFFRAIIATLLAPLLVESIARVIILVRHYRRDEAAAATTRRLRAPERLFSWRAPRPGALEVSRNGTDGAFA